jgi:hypothetical protein
MFRSVKPSEYRKLDEVERTRLKIERLCDGNWSAQHPDLREMYLVEDVVRMSRRCGICR